MATRSADLREMFGGRQDLALGGVDVLQSPGDDEDRFLAPDGRLDVRVRLVAQRLDLATCSSRPTRSSILFIYLFILL